MAMVLAQCLYDSIFYQTGAVPAYSGTVAVGFDPQNAYDWMDFSSFRPAAGTSTLEATFVAGGVIDTAVFWATASTVGLVTSIAVEYETAPATWASLGTFGVPTAGIKWLDLTPVTVGAGRKVRFVFTGVTGTIDIRQLGIGAKLEFPIGQWVGVNPPHLLQGIVTETVISVNGSILGRNVRRTEKSMEINLTLLLPDWVRTYWEPFAQAASKHAFWYRWSPVGYPTEVAFAAAMSIEPPRNAHPQPRMEVTMPLKVITD